MDFVALIRARSKRQRIVGSGIQAVGSLRALRRIGDDLLAGPLEIGQVQCPGTIPEAINRVISHSVIISNAQGL